MADYNSLMAAAQSGANTVTLAQVLGFEQHNQSEKLMLITIGMDSAGKPIKKALSKKNLLASKLGDNMTFIIEGDWARPTDVELQSFNLIY